MPAYASQPQIFRSPQEMRPRQAAPLCAAARRCRADTCRAARRASPATRNALPLRFRFCQPCRLPAASASRLRCACRARGRFIFTLLFFDVFPFFFDLRRFTIFFLHE
jgi:hypothetical protein